MNYLKEHVELKKNPQKLNENLKSVISITQSYYPAITPTPEKNPTQPGRKQGKTQREISCAHHAQQTSNERLRGRCQKI